MIKSGAKFCTSCGTPINMESAPVQTPIQETPEQGMEEVKSDAEPEAVRCPVCGHLQEGDSMGNASNSWEQEPVPYTDPNQYADPNLYTTPNAYADSNTYENYDSGEEPTSYGNYDGGEAPTSYGNYDSGEAPTSYREPEAMENPTQAPYGSDQMPVYMENRDGETMLLNETDNNGTVFLPEEEGRVITLTEQADRFKEFQLRLAPSATIGRVTDRNTLAFPDEKSISAVHCRVYTEGDHGSFSAGYHQYMYYKYIFDEASFTFTQSDLDHIE